MTTDKQDSFATFSLYLKDFSLQLINSEEKRPLFIARIQNIFSRCNTRIFDALNQHQPLPDHVLSCLDTLTQLAQPMRDTLSHSSIHSQTHLFFEEHPYLLNIEHIKQKLISATRQDNPYHSKCLDSTARNIAKDTFIEILQSFQRAGIKIPIKRENLSDSPALTFFDVFFKNCGFNNRQIPSVSGNKFPSTFSKYASLMVAYLRKTPLIVKSSQEPEYIDGPDGLIDIRDCDCTITVISDAKTTHHTLPIHFDTSNMSDAHILDVIRHFSITDQLI